MPARKPPETLPQPLAYRIEAMPHVAGIGVSKTKELIADGRLVSVKLDKLRLVMHEDLHALLARHREIRGNGSNGAASPPPAFEARAAAAAPRPDQVSSAPPAPADRGRPPK
jgi:hypothetical protein